MNSRTLLLAGLCLAAALGFIVTEPVGSANGTPPPVKGSEELKSLAENLFKRIDVDKKGFISKHDVEKAFLDHAIKGREAIALFVINEEFAALSAGADRLTLRQFAPFQRGVKQSALTDRIDERFTESEDFLKSVNRDLYPRGKEPESLAGMRNIQQAWRGNCYLLSGYGSLAGVDPKRLRQCITDNGVDTKSGVRTYTVVFPRSTGEKYVVEEFTDAALLRAEVQRDSGVWLAVMVRAYGQYMKKHAFVRLIERLFYKLDERVLPEDMTDNGSMNHEGLRMLFDPEQARLKQVLWGFDDAQIVSVIKEVLDRYMSDKPAFVRTLAALAVLPKVKAVLRPFLSPRDAAVAHELLKRSITDEHLPATVVKLGGSHEAAIIAYTPGNKTGDGKHQSKYGFVTVRDQAGGLSGPEAKKLQDGVWWRRPGDDDHTVSMTVEEFVSFYNGMAVVLKRR